MTTIALNEFEILAILAVLAAVVFCIGYVLGKEREW